MRNLISIAFLTAGIGLDPGAALAQATLPPTFGTGIEIINLNLSVTDPADNYITDLDRPDFAIYEDGIRQELSLFTHENLPISMVIMTITTATFARTHARRLKSSTLGCAGR